MRRLPLPLLILSAALTAGGGALHLRDWLRTYRAIPWDSRRLGRASRFPVNAHPRMRPSPRARCTTFTWYTDRHEAT